MTDKRLLSRLDLNLLVSLDALLSERSVTRAAERLQLSQPALSASLSRLRTHFDDPILARRGNAYYLTPLAVRLAEHTSTALEAARRVFESQATWTPGESTREFTLYGSDYGFATIGALVSERAIAEAPGVRFRFVTHNPTVVDDAAHHLRSVDGMIIPHGHVSDLSYTDLWRDRWVAVCADDNHEVGAQLTMEDLAGLPWVLTYQTRTAFTAAVRHAQLSGIEPHVEVIVESFLSLPHFIRGTRRLGMLQAGLAATAESLGGIRIVELPFEVGPIVNALWWHPVHSHDPEHAWMRRLFVEAAETLEELPSDS